MSLSTYWKKRRFNETPEPEGQEKLKQEKVLRFVIQKHHASHLHYDFRLEMEKVLKSWAVPKGPSMDPKVRRLAMMVEDHPYDYRTFEGVIPEGNYGAGKVIVWDEGTYEPIAQSDDPEKTLLEGLKNGDLKFKLNGVKVKGEFALVRIKTEEKSWLLIKKDDEYASKEDITLQAGSIVSGRDVEEVGAKTTKTSISKLEKIPTEIKPMLASLTDKPFNDPDWVFEVKWDGYRAVAQIEKSKVRVYSRNNQDFNLKYPSIVESLTNIKHDVVLDGEIVVVDGEGKSVFQLLQSYRSSGKGTLLYYIFDLLYLDGYDLRNQKLVDRKALLKSLIIDLPNIQYSDHMEENGVELFKVIKQKNIEGVIAKKKNSVYVSKRTNDWLKIKNIQEQEAIICGFTQPKGTRNKFGALLLGMYKDGKLTYVGHTGSGFDEDTLHSVSSILEPLIISHSPFEDEPTANAAVTWVQPKIVCQVKFSEITDAGYMRQAIFLGIREDKTAKEVEPEQIVSSSFDIAITNGDKIYWPDEGYTKLDMVEYYKKVSPILLPYLKDRIQTLNRFPNGINGKNFYQKDVVDPPPWLKTIPIERDDGKLIHYMVCENENAVLYMANLGCIEMNAWSSRYTKLEYPDYLIMDLDPNDVSFKETVKTAQCVKEILDKAQIDSFIKTSGKRGLHILLPLGAQYTFDQSKQFAEILAHRIHKELPDVTSIVRNPDKRQKKIYIDFLQNRRGQTIAAPYSLRPIKGAQVSTPLHWKELNDTLSPDQFTIKTIFKRLDKEGDIWHKLLNHPGIDMLKSLEKLSKL